MTAHVTTFYSFKGGVGRTMLMANCGVHLSRSFHQKTLLWDLDVEAPGFHRIQGLEPSPMPLRGFFDWLKAWQEANFPETLPEEMIDGLFDLVAPVPRAKGLSILPAFGASSDSPEAYNDIDWHHFLRRRPRLGLALFRNLLETLGERGGFEHILLDSRTGMTDLGGLMTAFLPHMTFLVGNYSNQNTRGLAFVHKALHRAVRGDMIEERGENAPNLSLMVAASPVPPESDELLKARRQTWKDLFKGLEKPLEIPFEPKLLLNEYLPALTDPESLLDNQYRKAAEFIEEGRDALLRARDQESRTRETRPDLMERDPKERMEKGATFEDRIARLLELLRFEVEREQLVDGNRVDLIARQEVGFESVCYLVECKDHKQAVPKKTLETLKIWTQGTEAAAMNAKAMAVAPRFSPAALTFAKSQGMVAVTPEELEKRLFDFKPYFAALIREFSQSPLARTYVAQRVLLEATREETGLLDYANAWARGEAGRNLWLLLGDYGTGKTVFFRRFAYTLAQRAAEDESAPLPLAIDLKRFPNAVTLETLIQEYVRVELGAAADPRTFLYLLKAGRLVLLLDAFDEMGTAAVGRSVEAQFRQLARAATQGEGRVMITCRTHFFRDQQQIKGPLMAGGDDDLVSHDSPLGKTARGFGAEMDELLLFDQKQIDAFLEKHLGGEQVEKAREFIAETHDLQSLAFRPVMLEMILKVLPGMAKEKGLVLTSGGLYHRFTTLWLEDLSGDSLQTTPKQRKLLLEQVAFDLWGRPEHRVHYADLGPLLAAHREIYRGLDPAQVDIELRSAAFLTRTNDGYYSFSHKSFREFFYARHLLRSLQAGGEALSDALATADMTPECVWFLADLLEEKDRPHLEKSLQELFSAPYRAGSAENALRLALWLHRKTGSWSMGKALPERANLAGAQLAEMDLAGAHLTGADLTGADLWGADVSDARAEGADLSGADLSGARLTAFHGEDASFDRTLLARIEAEGAHFDGASFREADLTAARLTDAALDGADFTGADLSGARLAGARASGAVWEGSILARATANGKADIPTPRPPPPPKSRLPVWQTGHNSAIRSAAFSPDGQRIVTASSDNTARLWDAQSGKEIRALKGHGHYVNAAAFSPDGQRIVTASSDNTARLWDAQSGKEIRALKGHGHYVLAAAFSPDGQRIVTASSDNTARLWDAQSGKEIRALKGHGHYVLAAAFSPDGQRIVTASDDNTARLWDAQSGKEIRALKGHGDWVKTAAFSPDGQRIVTASSDNTARLWDAQSGKEIRALKGHGHSVLAAAFSPDGQRIVTASDDNTARLWDAQSGKEIRALKGHGDWVKTAAFSPDGQRIVTASSDNTARLWDAQSGKEIRALKGHGHSVLAAAFSPDGQRIVTASSDNTARLWDAQSGKEIRALKGHGHSVLAAAFSPDGQRIVTASDDNTARLWDAQSGKEIRALKGHGHYVLAAAFSPDGQRIVTASDDNTARLWDAQSGKEIRALKGHGDWVKTAAFSPDGQRIVTASSDNTARLWDAQSGKEIRALKGHGDWVKTAAFSPDGQRIVTASSDNTARLWDAQSGKEIRALKGHGHSVLAAAFSPDGQRIVTASDDNTARLWDAQSGKEIRALKGHGHYVLAAAFSPDGQRIVTASSDNTARLWDAQSGKETGLLFPTANGWISQNAQGKIHWGGAGRKALLFLDAKEKELLPTLWQAEDLLTRQGTTALRQTAP